MYAGVPNTPARGRSVSMPARRADAEVEQLGHHAARRAARQEDVLGLEVAVDDARGVRGREAAADLGGDGERLGRRAGARAAMRCGERLALEQLHGEVEPVARPGLARVGDVDHVGVAELADDAHLAQEEVARVAARAPLAPAAAILSANSRPSSSWRAAHTVPIAPAPMGRRSR